MTLTLDLPPAEEAELRRLATAGDLPAVRAKLADRLDELAAGLAQPVRGDAESPERAGGGVSGGNRADGRGFRGGLRPGRPSADERGTPPREPL